MKFCFYVKGDSKLELNNIYHGDCMSYLPNMADNSVNLTLTDIPYGEVNRADNGLRTLLKEGQMN